MKRAAFSTMAVLFGWFGLQAAPAGAALVSVQGTANLYEAGTFTNFGEGRSPHPSSWPRGKSSPSPPPGRSS